MNHICSKKPKETESNFILRQKIHAVLFIKGYSFTSERFADEVSYGIDTLRSYSCGRRKIPEDFVSRLCNSLSLPVSLFADETTRINIPNEYEDYIAADIPEDIHALFNLLDRIGMEIQFNLESIDTRFLTLPLSKVKTYNINKPLLFTFNEPSPLLITSVQVYNVKMGVFSFSDYITSVICGLRKNDGVPSFKARDDYLFSKKDSFFYLASSEGAHQHDYARKHKQEKFDLYYTDDNGFDIIAQDMPVLEKDLFYCDIMERLKIVYDSNNTLAV